METLHPIHPSPLPAHEAITNALLQTITSFTAKNKRKMRIGSLLSLLNIIEKSELPPESLPKLIQYCEVARDAERLFEIKEKFMGLNDMLEQTIKNLKSR